MEQKTEFWFSVFAMGIAATNIILNLIQAPSTFLIPFSISMSVLIFYFAWNMISELEIVDRIKLLFYIYHLEKEAFKKARRTIENVAK